MATNNDTKRERVGMTWAELQDYLQGGGSGADTGGGTGGGPGFGPVEPPTGGDISPVGQTGPDQPPADPNATNNATVTPKPGADNSLLLFGGLALFALIAVPKGKLTGRSVPAASWLIPGVLLGGAFLYMRMKGKTAAEKKTALIDWLGHLSETEAPQETRTYFLTQLNAMSDAEISDVYDWVITYGPAPQTTAPQDLKDRIAVISAKYQIFT